MNASLFISGNPSRSIFKSPNTKPLRAEFCNMPVNCPEDFRNELDTLKGDDSRNTFLLKAIVRGVAALNPAKALRLQSILDAHKLAAQLAAGFALICVASLMVFEHRRNDMASVRVIRSSVRKMGDGEVFMWEEAA